MSRFLLLPAAAAAACTSPSANDLLQTLDCASAQNTLKWQQASWNPNTGGSLQLSGTSLCMQAGPGSAAGSYLAVQLAPCSGAAEQLFAPSVPSGIASTWLSHVDGSCLDANSGSQHPNERLETYQCSGDANQLYTYNITTGIFSDASWGYCVGTC